MLVTNLSSATSTGAMERILSLTSLLMYKYQIALPLLSAAVTIHALDLYALVLPFVSQSDKHGRKKVIVADLTTSGFEPLITLITQDFFVST